MRLKLKVLVGTGKSYARLICLVTSFLILRSTIPRSFIYSLYWEYRPLFLTPLHSCHIKQQTCESLKTGLQNNTCVPAQDTVRNTSEVWLQYSCRSLTISKQGPSGFNKHSRMVRHPVRQSVVLTETAVPKATCDFKFSFLAL